MLPPREIFYQGKQRFKKWLLTRDVILSRPPGQFSIGDIKLARTKQRGLQINSAIDGGASHGTWAREFRKIYPDARILCVEPREECKPGLDEMVKDLGPGAEYALTLLGPTEGSMKLNTLREQSSIFNDVQGRPFGEVKEFPVTTLDKLVASRGFPGPDLIKLDLQGAELQALHGATECLKRAQMLMIEVSFLEMYEGLPLVSDIITFAHDHGFRVYDIPALWHRPLDGALAQGDFTFIKEGHPLIADRRWSADRSTPSPTTSDV